MELMAIFEYVIYLILAWSGTYANKMMDDNRTITLPALRTALNSDRDLADLIDRLFDESEYDSGEGNQQNDPQASPKLSRSGMTDPNQYEKICRTFCKDEKVFIEDVSTIVCVFKRRLEQGIATDNAGKVLYLYKIYFCLEVVEFHIWKHWRDLRAGHKDPSNYR